MSGWSLAARLALRELRGARAGLIVFVACLALGVGAIAGVGSASSAMMAGLAEQGRALIGGDLELRLTQRPASDAERGFVASLGETSEVIEMRAMARLIPAAAAAAGAAPDPESARTLVELKAVDAPYPLAGELLFEPAGSRAAMLGRDAATGLYGVAVERPLLIRLDAGIGDRLAIGDAVFEIRGVVVSEGDRVSGGLAFGPRAMIEAEALAQTGLVREGSLARWFYRINLSDNVSLDDAVARAEGDWPDAGWRIRDHRDGAPQVRRFLERLEQLLTLVGLSALAIGGVGVANAARGWLESRIETIATLKCLGADGATVFRIYILQAVVLTFLGVLAGLAIGALAPVALAVFGGEVLPVPPQVAVYPGPLAAAAAYGFAVSLAFAIWPVAQARETPPARLFRDLAEPARRWPRPGYLAAIAGLAAAAVALAFVFGENRLLTMWFFAGLVVALALLRIAAWGVGAAARRVGMVRSPVLRLAISALRRPGAATSAAIVSLGLGLGVSVTIAGTEATLNRVISEELPARAPAYFLIDIQTDQLETVRARVLATPGVEDVEAAPMLRGRLTSLKGVAPNASNVAPDAQWVLRGDRGLTYSAAPPEGAKIVAGEWWPADYAGPTLVSFDAELARALGVGVGDEIGVNVLGREMTAQIASLREIDWTNFGINFVMVFSPNPLASAPHAWIMTVAGPPSAEGAILRAATGDFANVSAIGVREAIATARGLIERIGGAMSALSVVSIAAGAFVLAGALAAGRRARIYDAMVLKAIGATRGRILAGYALEYGMLGAVAAVIAALVGTLAAWAVATFAIDAPFAWEMAPVAMAIGGAGGLVALAGLAAGWRALGARPADALRGR